MKKTIFFIGSLLVCTLGVSQTTPNSNVSAFYFKEHTPKTPEVSSLGTYGEFQASPYNGKANISIPLHTLVFDGKEIPISLSYNSLGIRVSQDAGWVGLNWNLSTSFAISRTIYGGDDFDNTPARDVWPDRTSIQVPQSGYLYNFFELPPPATGSSTPSVPIDDLYRVFGSFNQTSQVEASAEVDTQPDIFEANVFGATYKFRLNKKGASNIITTEIFNNNNVVITLNLASMTFTIVDDQGFTYTFSSKEKSTTFAPVNGDQGFGSSKGPGTYPGFLVEIRGDKNKEDEEVVTGWFLDSVVSPNGNVLNFSYTDGLSFTFPAPQQRDSNAGLIVNEYRNNLINKEPIGFTSVLQHQYLSQISGDFGSIDFELGAREDLSTLAFIKDFTGYPNTSEFEIGPLQIKDMIINYDDPDRSKKLNAMVVRDFLGNPVKTVTFNTGYFNDDKLEDPLKERFLRLKLEGVDVNERSYTFDYLDSNELPPKDSRSIDFWGFYNGVPNTNIVPTIGRFVSTKFADKLVTGQYFLQMNGGIRKSDFDFGKKGLLNRVTYPTQGYTEISYEPHDVVLPVVQPFTVTEEININGTTKMRWTDMVDESRYGFTYQYLKYANDPSYNYFNLPPPVQGDAIETSLGMGTVFTIDFPSRVNINGTVRYITGEINPSYTGNFYAIENTLTGAMTPLIDYSECPNFGDPPRYIEKDALIGPGTYRVMKTRPSGAPLNDLNPENITLYTYENENSDPTDFFERFEIGGARVQQIVNRDSDGKYLTGTAYSYDFLEGINGLKSSGILMDDLIFFSSANGYHSHNPHSYSQQGVSFTSTNELGNTQSAQGSHIGYSFVQERKVDSIGNSLGRRDMVFQNRKNQYFTESWSDKPFTYASTTSFEYDVQIRNAIVLGLPPRSNSQGTNGLLDFEYVYDENDELVLEKRNFYRAYRGSSDVSFFAKFMTTNEVDLNFIPRFNQYFYHKLPEDFFDQYLLSSTETKEFLEGETTKTETEYVYNPITHYNEVTTTILNEREALSNFVFYPYDDEVAQQNGIVSLLDENKLSTIVREERYRDAAPLTTVAYGYGNSADQTAGNTLLTEVRTAKGEGDLILQSVVQKYDAKGNMLQYKKADGPQQRMLWGYNDQYPIAKIENMGQENILALESQLRDLSEADNDHCSQGSCAEQQLRNAQQTLREALPDAMVTTYTYDPLIGITSMTDPRGYTIYYQYDEQNRLKAVRDADGNLLNDYEYAYKNPIIE
ncbi:hypothetical protein [Maribacter sp. 2-571]|uniref:hypothetical protein n=1 Tax=Maribacter sp. 2-571 TaxID=3417569 RepID=UPI003D32F63E